MNKGILIKAGIILGFFGVVLGLAFGCSAVKDNDVTPSISDSDSIYLTVGDITVTRQELWESMRISDGATYLTQLAEEILLASYIDGITPEEVDTAILKATYGTDDAEEIAKIQADPEENQDYLDAYEQNLFILGFDPENEDDLKDYVKLNIAKEKATRAYILAATEGDSLFVSDEDLETYYNNKTKGNVCVLDIKFNSEKEAENVLDKFDLVPDYESGFGKYFGEDDITTLKNSDFNDTNTTELTEDEVFTEFVSLYNYMNPNNQLSVGVTLENYCEDNAEIATRNWTEMTEDRSSSDTNVKYANYIFTTLGIEEEDVRFSIKPKASGNFSMLTFKVSEDLATDFADLTEPELDTLFEDVLESLITETSINIVVSELWADTELEIFDPMIKLQYEQQNSVTFKNNGDDELIATVGDVEITADQLFSYMDNSIGTYYAINLVQEKRLIDSVFYTAIYGDSHDYMNSDNEELAAHRETLRNLKGAFGNNAYAGYGFSSADYTWEEFLILVYRNASESDAIKNLYVLGALQPYTTGASVDYTEAIDFIQDQADNYFSLNIEHLLIYVDFDNDFAPDEYNEIVEALTGDDLIEYDALLLSLENLINEEISDGATFETIVNDFQDSLIGDEENVWAAYKEYGFYIMTQNLSEQVTSSGTKIVSITYANKDLYDEDFFNAMIRVYDSYVLEVNSSIEEITEYYDTQLVQSNFGLHLIYATEGDDFEQPTAVYDNTDGDKSEGSGGTTLVPNADQVALYMAIEWADLIGEDTDLLLPTSVKEAIEAYYGPVYEKYYSGSGYSIATTEWMIENGVVYTTNPTENLTYLNGVLEVLKDINFGELVIED